MSAIGLTHVLLRELRLNMNAGGPFMGKRFKHGKVKRKVSARDGIKVRWKGSPQRFLVLEDIVVARIKDDGVLGISTACRGILVVESGLVQKRRGLQFVSGDDRLRIAALELVMTCKEGAEAVDDLAADVGASFRNQFGRAGRELVALLRRQVRVIEALVGPPIL